MTEATKPISGIEPADSIVLFKALKQMANETDREVPEAHSLANKLFNHADANRADLEITPSEAGVIVAGELARKSRVSFDLLRHIAMKFPISIDPKSKPIEHNYGPSWPSRRHEAIERDNFECQQCGLSQQKHRQEFNGGLHVHHIKPFNEFDDRTEANRLENLMTVCCSCHRKIEVE